MRASTEWGGRSVSQYSQLGRSSSAMVVSPVSNYLFFTTTCEQALAFYTRCGLGKVTQMMRYGVDGMPAPTEAMRGKIMHARFEGPGVLFYASDNHDAEPMRGSAHLLMIDDRENMDRLFDRLAEGGIITTARDIQPWGDYYGKLTDRFGVQWMLDCPI
jgi:PhnB protein